MGEKTGDNVSNFATLQEENENPASNAQNQPSYQSPKAAKITAVIIAVILLVIIVSLVGLKGNKNEPKQAKLATTGNRDNLRQDNSKATNPNETTTEFDPFTATISSMSPNKTETTTEFDPLAETISSMPSNKTETTTEFDQFTATISSMSPNKTETTTEFDAFTETISSMPSNKTETTIELDPFDEMFEIPSSKYPQPITVSEIYPYENLIIMSNVDGTVLDVEHSSHEVGANLDLWPYVHGRNQIFSFRDANFKEEYDFYIKNYNSDLFIGVNALNKIVQVPLEINPSIWKIRNVPAVEGLYTIHLQNFKSPDKCLGNVRSPVAGLMMSNSLELVNCDLGEQTYFRIISDCTEV